MTDIASASTLEIAEVKPAARSRIAGVDGLRAIAALGVMIYHYSEFAFGTNLGPLRYGLLGVDIFFVISGFVIFFSLSKQQSIPTFALHRAARLYPAYWVSVVCGALLTALAGHPKWLLAALNLTMLQGFFEGSGKVELNLINAYWTLQFELWFYVLLGCVFFFRQQKRIEQFALVWLLVFSGLQIAAIGLHWTAALDLVRNHATRFSMVHFGQLFIAGMMVARLRSGGTRLTLPVLLLAIAYCGFGRTDWGNVSGWIYLPLIATTVLALLDCTKGGSVARLLSLPPLRFIGVRSYSLYLMHGLTLEAAVQAMIGRPVAEIVTAATILAVAVSAITWRYIERPLIEGARRYR